MRHFLRLCTACMLIILTCNTAFVHAGSTYRPTSKDRDVILAVKLKLGQLEDKANIKKIDKIYKTLNAAAKRAKDGGRMEYILSKMEEDALRAKIRANKKAEEEKMRAIARKSQSFRAAKDRYESTPKKTTKNTTKYKKQSTKSIKQVSNASKEQKQVLKKHDFHVDIEEVRATVLAWINEEREQEGLHPYVYNDALDATALEWSMTAKAQGYINHDRTPNRIAAEDNYHYYDFADIDNWFVDRNIDPIVINRAKHTENVGWGGFYCEPHESDCTQEVLRGFRAIHEYFMAEKGQAYDAHYRTIMQPHFTQVGIGFVIVPEIQRTFITYHYTTDFPETLAER